MNRKLLSACVLAGLAFASQQAFAADGTITFTGQIYANTCTINGNGSGSGNFSVTLPSAVSSTQLDVAGKTAGRTAFQIALTNCPAAANVHTFYEPGPTTDAASGRLKNTAVAGAATNVQIQLLNADGVTPIKAGFADSQQDSHSVGLVGNAATLSYFAEYYATGAATAGAVTSSVAYTIVYN